MDPVDPDSNPDPEHWLHCCRELVLCGTVTNVFKSVFCTGTRVTVVISFLISIRKDLKLQAN
jgi:hypothetical protein